MIEQLALALRTDDEHRVADVLRVVREHAGRGRAITIDDLAHATGLSYRDVQAAKKYLVEELAEPIGSAWSKPYGYYLIHDARELEHNFFQFGRRGVSNLRHMRAYATPALRASIVGQLNLFFHQLVPLLDELQNRVPNSKDLL